MFAEPDADRRGNPDDDLAWDAFRYVADEMTTHEVEAFEQRLIEDQATREAVAAAVDHLGAITLVARELRTTQPAATAPTRAIRQRRRRSAAAILATAAVVFLATWGGTRWVFGPGSVDVALAWTSLRGEATAADGSISPTPEVNPGEPAGGSESAMTETGLVEVNEVPAERPLPSWMVAAVAPSESTDDAPSSENN